MWALHENLPGVYSAPCIVHTGALVPSFSGTHGWGPQSPESPRKAKVGRGRGVILPRRALKLLHRPRLKKVAPRRWGSNGAAARARKGCATPRPTDPAWAQPVPRAQQGGGQCCDRRGPSCEMRRQPGTPPQTFPAHPGAHGEGSRPGWGSGILGPEPVRHRREVCAARNLAEEGRGPSLPSTDCGPWGPPPNRVHSVQGPRARFPGARRPETHEVRAARRNSYSPGHRALAAGPTDGLGREAE